MKNALSQMIYVNFKELLHSLSITSVGITLLTLLGSCTQCLKKVQE